MKDRVALITGGARGIGYGIAQAFAAAGARVMIADLGTKADPGWAYALSGAGELDGLGGGPMKTVEVDVTRRESCADAVAATMDAFGRIDVLVNNAGVVQSGPIDTFAETDWDRIFDVNVKGIFLMTQAALPALKASPDAAILITASIAGKKGYPNMAAYCGSKFAAVGITQSLAQELAPDGIRVNAICPGMVGTAMWLEHLLPSNATDTGQRHEEFDALMQRTIPLGRAQTVEDMGQAAVYLVSAPNVTGVALNVAGGFEMS